MIQQHWLAKISTQEKISDLKKETTAMLDKIQIIITTILAIYAEKWGIKQQIVIIKMIMIPDYVIGVTKRAIKQRIVLKIIMMILKILLGIIPKGIIGQKEIKQQPWLWWENREKTPT